MKEELYFINKGNNCSPKIPSRFTNYLDKNNFLSEFQSEESKLNVKDNLGITSDLTTIKNLIDRKVIESGNIAWDLIPTEGNTESVLSSDSLYKEFLKYVTEELLDLILLEFFTTLNLRIDQELNSRATEDLNLSERIENLQTLYNSLKETLLLQLILFIINSYEKRIKSMEAKVDSFLKSIETGVALANEFGDNTFVGVNQKTLTESLNKLWAKFEDITGEILLGINMIITPTFFVSEDGCDVHISANTVETNGIFEKIQFFIDGELIHEDTNTELVSFDHHLDIKNEYEYIIMCKAKIMGIEYTRQQIVTRYNEFYVGSGSIYSDVMDSVHARQLNGTMRHNYNVEFNNGDKLIIVIGASLRNGFIRADLNGTEILFTEEIVTIDDKQYMVLTSDAWNGGEYNIDING